MSKANDEKWTAQTQLDAQKLRDWAQASRAGGFGDWYQQMAQTQAGKQQGAIDQYLPQLQSLFGNLLTQQQAGVGQITPMNARQLSEGYSPEAKAALTTQALQGIPGQFDTAMSNLKGYLGSRGMTTSGNAANLMGTLMTQKELAKSGALSNITLGNEALRNQNIQANRMFNLSNLNQAQQFALQKYLGQMGAGSNLYNTQLGTLGTLGQLYSPNAYMQSALGALGAQNQAEGLGGQMAQARTNPNLFRSSFWDQYGGSILGAGMNLATMGLGGIFGSGSSFPATTGGPGPLEGSPGANTASGYPLGTFYQP